MIENRSMPAVSVIPELVYHDVGRACEWLCRVFGFRLRWRAGDHRAQLAYGDGALIVAESRLVLDDAPGSGIDFEPDRQGPIGHAILVRVPDADAHYAHAREHGARILEAPRDFPYGERQYRAVDLAGHHWTFSESIADVAPEDWGGQTAR